MSIHRLKELPDQWPRRAVIKFTAVWCGPCKTIGPHYKDLSTEYPQIQFYEVDVDQSESIAEHFSIRSMPTFVFLKSGKEVNRFSGADKSKLSEYLELL